MREKRKHVRFSGLGVVASYAIDDDPKKRKALICKDISLSGIKVLGEPKQLPNVNFLLRFSNSHIPFEIDAAFKWSADGSSGFSFIGDHPKSKQRILDYIYQSKRHDKRNLEVILDKFSFDNKRIVVNLFSSALEVLHHQQVELNKPTLKPKMILSALDLVKDVILKFKPVKAEGELGIFLNKRKIGEEIALNYWTKYLSDTEVKDSLGRAVKLDDKVFDSLYKDPVTGKKGRVEGKFNKFRAQRLPWIVYTIKNCDRIYELKEKDWITYYYCMPFHVPINDSHTHTKRYYLNNYLIVAKKKRGKPIEFITAYVPDSQTDLLRKICCARLCKL